jgi:hypothetical protein
LVHCVGVAGALHSSKKLLLVSKNMSYALHTSTQNSLHNCNAMRPTFSRKCYELMKQN